jgi:hypothetical protein
LQTFIEKNSYLFKYRSRYGLNLRQKKARQLPSF